MTRHPAVAAIPTLHRAVVRLLAALVVAGLFAGAAAAQEAPPAPAEATQPAVQRFLDLLAGSGFATLAFGAE